MVVAILAITNPGRKQYSSFEMAEGKMTDNYFIFSVYRQYSGFTVSKDGKYRLYKRHIGILMSFYEIEPLKVALD